MASIREILPDEVIVVEQMGSPVGSLLKEEAEALGQTVYSRHIEFASGRTCARSALEALGVPTQPILRGLSREPIWPIGIAGSITHCAGYCAAAVTSNHSIKSIGIDAEPNEPLPDRVLREIATEYEIRSLGVLPSALTCWDRLLFSAKESVYKAWYPIMRCWLGFEEVYVTIDTITKTYQAQIGLNHPRAQEFDSLLWYGRYTSDTSLIITSMVIYRKVLTQTPFSVSV
jgi:4'-phosphopantetheinyl transferase EntD